MMWKKKRDCKFLKNSMHESNKAIKTMETNNKKLQMEMVTETTITNVKLCTNLIPHRRMLKLI